MHLPTIALPSFAALFILGHAALSLFFRLHTPAQWVAFAQGYPRVARFIRPGSGAEHLVVDALEALRVANAEARPPVMARRAPVSNAALVDPAASDSGRTGVDASEAPLSAADLGLSLPPRLRRDPFGPGSSVLVGADGSAVIIATDGTRVVIAGTDPEGDHPDATSLDLAAAAAEACGPAEPELGVLEGAAARTGGGVGK